MTEHAVTLHPLSIGKSSKPRRRERERRRPAEVLPASLPPLGLSLDEVAAFIGVSPNKYLDLVRRGLMPQPRMVDGRRVYDRELAHAAFKHLPTANGRGTSMTGSDRETTTWEDIDNAT